MYLQVKYRIRCGTTRRLWRSDEDCCKTLLIQTSRSFARPLQTNFPFPAFPSYRGFYGMEIYYLERYTCVFLWLRILWYCRSIPDFTLNLTQHLGCFLASWQVRNSDFAKRLADDHERTATPSAEHTVRFEFPNISKYLQSGDINRSFEESE